MLRIPCFRRPRARPPRSVHRSRQSSAAQRMPAASCSSGGRGGVWTQPLLTEPQQQSLPTSRQCWESHRSRRAAEGQVETLVRQRHQMQTRLTWLPASPSAAGGGGMLCWTLTAAAAARLVVTASRQRVARASPGREGMPPARLLCRLVTGHRGQAGALQSGGRQHPPALQSRAPPLRWAMGTRSAARLVLQKRSWRPRFCGARLSWTPRRVPWLRNWRRCEFDYMARPGRLVVLHYCKLAVAHSYLRWAQHHGVSCWLHVGNISPMRARSHRCHPPGGDPPGGLLCPGGGPVRAEAAGGAAAGTGGS